MVREGSDVSVFFPSFYERFNVAVLIIQRPNDHASVQAYLYSSQITLPPFTRPMDDTKRTGVILFFRAYSTRSTLTMAS